MSILDAWQGSQYASAAYIVLVKFYLSEEVSVVKLE